MRFDTSNNLETLCHKHGFVRIFEVCDEGYNTVTNVMSISINFAIFT